MQPDKNISRLKKEQLDIAAQTLARSFQGDPMYTYVIPDDEQRKN